MSDLQDQLDDTKQDLSEANAELERCRHELAEAKDRIRDLERDIDSALNILERARR